MPLFYFPSTTCGRGTKCVELFLRFLAGHAVEIQGGRHWINIWIILCPDPEMEGLDQLLVNRVV